MAAEIDREGRVVWWLAAGMRCLSLDADASGRRAVGLSNGTVRVYDPNGEIIRSFKARDPVDIDWLENGNILVTSAGEGKVREFDEEGNVVWDYSGLLRPRDADRLPDGNTLICDTGRNRVLEVSPAGHIEWSLERELKHPYDADRVDEDRILIANYDGGSVVLVRRDNRFLWQFRPLRHPNSVYPLPDGSSLVSEAESGFLIRLDVHGRLKKRWMISPRLEDFAVAPNGNLLFSAIRVNRASGSPEAAEDLGEIPRIFVSGSRGGWHARSSWPPIALGVSLLVLLMLFWVGTRRFAGFAPGRRVLLVAAVFPAGVALFVLWTNVREPHARIVSDSRDPAGDNLVLVLFDSLRKDHVPFSGYWRNTTPRIMELVPEALVFDQCIMQAPWTKPSIASLFTSTYQANHQVLDEQSTYPLSSSLVTLAEVLSENGYYTGAVMENPHMGVQGFDQGFDAYYLPNRGVIKGKTPAITADLAIEFLDLVPREQPFFLLLFFMNPHYPYAPREGVHFDEEISVVDFTCKYDSEILEADAQVGRVLDALRERGLMNDTVFMFTSDHGEGLGDHDERYHGKTLYDTILNVPLLIYGLGERGEFPGLVREIDLMPTLLDYLGTEVPEEFAWQMAGISLRPLIRRKAFRTGITAFSETKFRDCDRRSIRTEDRKIIVDHVTGTVQVYDLVNDPQELNDLIQMEHLRLEKWAEGQWVVEEETEKSTVPDDILEEMKAIGYLQDD